MLAVRPLRCPRLWSSNQNHSRAQDSPNDHQALPILDHAINKPAINLDLVEIQCLQLCKRRTPGPEIVEGDSNSRLPQFVDHSLRHVDIFYKRALTWTAKTLDEFIADPQKVVVGNRMPYAGLPDADDRADLIVYLEKATK